jgi:hypothetical protein
MTKIHYLSITSQKKQFHKERNGDPFFKIIFKRLERDRERVERMPEENERRKIQRLKKECVRS